MLDPVSVVPGLMSDEDDEPTKPGIVATLMLKLKAGQDDKTQTKLITAAVLEILREGGRVDFLRANLEARGINHKVLDTSFTKAGTRWEQERKRSGPGHNSLDREKLREIVQRIENIEAERAELAADIKDVVTEAKSAGFDVRAIRTIIKMRKSDQVERDARQSLVDEYMAALGMLADTPLGAAAISRASQLMPPV